jgi:ribosomal RNA-processing protein 8
MCSRAARPTPHPQVKLWPQQPLDAAIAWLKQQPPGLVVTDFGCGDARLAASVQQVCNCYVIVMFC